MDACHTGLAAKLGQKKGRINFTSITFTSRTLEYPGRGTSPRPRNTRIFRGNGTVYNGAIRKTVEVIYRQSTSITAATKKPSKNTYSGQINRWLEQISHTDIKIYQKAGLKK